MLKIFLRGFVVLALHGAACAWAQAEILNFDQVLEAARASHPLVQGRRAGQAAARAEREGAEWQRYPTPTLEASSQGGGQSSGQSNAALRLDQPLWAGGRITAGIDAAGSRVDAAAAALAETRLDLTFKVIAVYSEALRQAARRQHAEAGVREHERLLAMIKRRVGQEVSSAADQRFAEVRLYQASNDLSLATQGYRNALLQLGQLAGAPVGGVTALVDEQGGLAKGLDEALALARTASPTLKRLRFEEEGANADIAARRSSLWPQLTLRLEKTAGQVSDNRALLVLSAQPGAGLSAGSNVEAAMARREAARMARETALRDLDERVTLDWNEWQAARERLGNAEQAQTMSTEVFESYARQYVTGRKSWIDVLNAVREATQSQWAVDDARAQVAAAALRLRAQMGRLLPVMENLPLPTSPTSGGGVQGLTSPTSGGGVQGLAFPTGVGREQTSLPHTSGGNDLPLPHASGGGREGEKLNQGTQP